MRSRRRFAGRRQVTALVTMTVVLGMPGFAASTATAASKTARTHDQPDATVGDTANGRRGVVEIKLVTVGDPGNPSVGVVSAFNGNNSFVEPPANGGVYKSCREAPPGPPNCLTVGSVSYEYQIAELETTVAQYVTFLNTVDPSGKHPRKLYLDYMNATAWPKYGSIAYSPGSGAGLGEHYAVAYPEWADKPFGFADFLRSARFVNSLTNGDVLSRTESSSGDFKYVTYKIRMSRQIESGMYDMRNPKTKRTASTGFVIPSTDEWIKAGHYDPKGGGTDSYWQYPTGPTEAPNVSSLDPATGDVVNAAEQPLASYSPSGPPNAPAGTFPTWCPPQAGSTCETVDPLNNLPGLAYQPVFQGNLSTVGQTATTSPWGTKDQGGNVVEWQDNIVPPPVGYTPKRTWRRMHGGVANAAAYQMLISAFGFQPQDQAVLDGAYPWFGFRVGVVGDLK